MNTKEKGIIGTYKKIQQKHGAHHDGYKFNFIINFPKMCVLEAKHCKYKM